MAGTAQFISNASLPRALSVPLAPALPWQDGHVTTLAIALSQPPLGKAVGPGRVVGRVNLVCVEGLVLDLGVLRGADPFGTMPHIANPWEAFHF